MTWWGWVILVVVVLAVTYAAGARQGYRMAGGVGPRSARAERGLPARPVPVNAATGWKRTAVYVYKHARASTDPALVARPLYVGISTDPQLRLGQHLDAPDEPWTSAVVDVEAHWFHDRYIALGVEWALIHYLRPLHNRHPSGSCDQYSEARPPIVPAPVRLPGRLRRALPYRRTP